MKTIKDKALQHYAETKTWPNYTNNIIGNSVIFYAPKEDVVNDVEVISYTTSECIFKMDFVETPFVLNFASYTNPGGGFLKGMMAQEESLCHDSNLYLNLSEEEEVYNLNKKTINDGLYTNRYIYSPDIIFQKNDIFKTANVLTISAPNNTGRILPEINTIELSKRIETILAVAKEYNNNILILGAFGCGVFKQDPVEVANLFKYHLKHYKFDKVYFAIPFSKENNNYETFKEIFDDTDLA